MNVAVKICGLTEPEGLRAAVEGGADYIGLNFVPTSRRFIAPQEAALLLAPYEPQRRTGATASQNAFPKIVGLFADPSDDELRAALAHVPLDRIQLHGNESPRRVAEIKKLTGLPTMKAIPLAAPEDLAAVPAYEAVADMLLFDAKIPSLRRGEAAGAIQRAGKNVASLAPQSSGWLRCARNDDKEERTTSGGTGQSFDWSILQGRRFALPWMLAGGLTPENVSEAIAATGAKSVDVSSGVETGTKKDPEKIRAFLKAAKIRLPM